MCVYVSGQFDDFLSQENKERKNSLFELNFQTTTTLYGKSVFVMYEIFIFWWSKNDFDIFEW